MPRIKCASCECKWNNDNLICTYKGTILMNDCSVVTLNEGRKHYHYCKMFEESEKNKQFEQMIRKYLGSEFSNGE